MLVWAWILSVAAGVNVAVEPHLSGSPLVLTTWHCFIHIVQMRN